MMDGKTIRRKLIGNDEQRAVSPVIGVILMVAITVILAAVIAAFVLDMGQGQSQNAQAGVTIEGAASSLEITVNSAERVDTLKFSGCTTNPSDISNPSVGDTATADCSGSGDELQVIGVYDGSETIITTYEP